MIEIKLRNRWDELPSVVKRSLKKKVRTVPMYNNIDIRTFHFYEWSDLTRKPCTMYGLNAFKGFLSAYGIAYPKHVDDKVKEMNAVHSVCRTNGELLVSSSKEGLSVQMLDDLPF